MWESTVAQLLLAVRENDKNRISELLEVLNTLIYPVEGVGNKDGEAVLGALLASPLGFTSATIIQLAQLTSNLLTQQKLSLLPATLGRLLQLLHSWLPRVHPPTELLYATAALVQAGAQYTDPQVLAVQLCEGGSLLRMVEGKQYPVEAQRAALHLLATLCGRLELPQPLLLSLLEVLLQCLLAPPSLDLLLHAKLLLSLLRAMHALLLRLSAPPSHRLLPSLLASLKASMALGLPGQLRHVATPMQPPLNVQLCPQPGSPRSPSVAGPHHRKRNRSRNREKGKGGVVLTGVAAHGPSLPPSFSCSSSDSELSDSEGISVRLRTTNNKLRHEAHSCLALLFQSVDRHTAFSYWLSFLPDGPRPPSSPPFLLTCLLKDPSPKCRGGAVSVLCAMLEGSKPYLAAADDRPLPSQPFTPYSSTLGAVLRELHRCLLLALAAEPHHTTLTQIIKCLSLLVANTPYSQLTQGYITRVASSLSPYTSHKDLDVQVACLTCYGAVVSLHPCLREVEQWLGLSSCPWVMEHCLALLQSPSPLALHTEALQVLTALCRFYFPAIAHCWSALRALYFSHLAQLPPPLQQHTLKLMEELCRAVSQLVPPPTDLWQQLLSGPLTRLLQHPAQGPLCAQACDVLATIGPAAMQELQVPLRMLAITLPLGLSREETASTTVTSSAVRVLGVFVSYDCLKEDSGFVLDCHSAVLYCLHLPSLPVRVQASWALGNLTDSLASLPTLPPALLLPLYEAVCERIGDTEKVKCNAVRAAGNLLKMLTEPVLSCCRPAVGSLSAQLAKCINSGSMKSRWNTCYACHSALANSVFTSQCPAATQELLTALCLAVQSCKNFKVRTNAALALASPAGYTQLCEVWGAVVEGLEGSEHQEDFSEFRHASSLRAQLCSTLLHLLSVMSSEQASALAALPMPDTALRHLREFLLVAAKEPSGDGLGSAWSNLKTLGPSVGGQLHQLLDMFQGVWEEVG